MICTYLKSSNINDALILVILVVAANYSNSTVTNTIYGKTFKREIFTVRIENELSRETFAVAVSFNNECLI